MENLKHRKWIDMVNWLLLLLLSVRLFNFPNKLTILWGAVLWIYSYQRDKKNAIDVKSIFLFVGMAVHAAAFQYYNEGYSALSMAELALTPFFTYIIGKLLVHEKTISFAGSVKVLILTISCGIALHASLNYFIYLKTGFIISSGKRWCDVWNGIPLFATEHSFFAVAFAGLLFYGIWELIHKQWGGLLIIAGVAWVNYINIKVANRMVFAVTVVVFAFNIVLYIFLNYTNKNKMKLFLYIAGGALLICLIFWNIDPFHIKESSFFDALLNRDGGIVKNVRFQIQFRALTQIIPHWLGGGTMELGFDNAHNFWLQIANMSGIIPFISLMVYTLWNLVDMCRLIYMKHIDETIKYLVPSVFLALMCYLLMEQGGHGTPDYFMYFTLVGGIISQILIQAKGEESKGNEYPNNS